MAKRHIERPVSSTDLHFLSGDENEAAVAARSTTGMHQLPLAASSLQQREMVCAGEKSHDTLYPSKPSIAPPPVPTRRRPRVSGDAPGDAVTARPREEAGRLSRHQQQVLTTQEHQESISNRDHPPPLPPKPLPPPRTSGHQNRKSYVYAVPAVPSKRHNVPAPIGSDTPATTPPPPLPPRPSWSDWASGGKPGTPLGLRSQPDAPASALQENPVPRKARPTQPAVRPPPALPRRRRESRSRDKLQWSQQRNASFQAAMQQGPAAANVADASDKDGVREASSQLVTSQGPSAEEKGSLEESYGDISLLGSRVGDADVSALRGNNSSLQLLYYPGHRSKVSIVDIARGPASGDMHPFAQSYGDFEMSRYLPSLNPEPGETILFWDGIAYAGSIAGNKPQPHGWGKMLWRCGATRCHKYIGNFDNGTLCGAGTMTWANNKIGMGQWQRNQLCGQHASISWGDGRRYTGSVERCVPHGPGKLRFANGDLLECRGWKHGHPNGVSRFTYADGRRTARGILADGKEHLCWVYHVDGDCYRGFWWRGDPEGSNRGILRLASVL